METVRISSYSSHRVLCAFAVSLSLLNAILALPIPIVDVTIENPYSLGGIIFGRASLRPLACWTVGCIAICSTGVQRFKTLGFENAHLLTM